MIRMVSMLGIAALLCGSVVMGGCKDRNAAPEQTPKTTVAGVEEQSESVERPVPSSKPAPSAHVLALLNSEQCAAQTLTDPDANHTVHMPLAVISGMDRYDLRLAPEPALPPLNKPFELRVTITERSSGKPAPVGAQVELAVDAWMPEHLHGLTARPSIRAAGEGVYTVSNLLLHMEGKWQMFFDITDGPLTERAQIDLAIR